MCWTTGARASSRNLTARALTPPAAADTINLAPNQVWVRFEAVGEDEARTEAEQLSARFKGWTFRLGAWKERSLAPTLDDLRAPPPPGPNARQAPPE